MEITGTTSQIQDYITQQANVEQTEALYQVKLMKMMQDSEKVVSDVLEDTLEISQDAMNQYLSEVKGK